MRIVVALGGNALLRRGEAMTVENQRANVRIAAEALAPLAEEHELLISHGNGPQVGLLALQADAYKEVEAYPLDVLGAQSEGMIGYMIEQELGNVLPYEQPLATLLTMIEVDPDDPAFANPSKPIGPLYTEEDARALAAEKGWTVKPDGDMWRRVVPSPLPQHVFQLRPIKWLLDKGTVVICTGGGGIPTMYDEHHRLQGAEVVIDKDFASALLAREIAADLYIMATDADAVYLDWGTPKARPLGDVTYEDLKSHRFAAGSMHPKILAACWFAQVTGHRAVIGSLADLEKMVAGKAGTSVRQAPGRHDELFGVPLR
jgi:carbamate kinase